MSNSVISAIDIGSNSFHLLIIKKEKNNLITLFKKKEIIRLGSEYGAKQKKISPKEIKKSIKILKGFREISEKYNAKILAKATSALREAKNKKKYIIKIYKETGIKIIPITGVEEAEFIYKGMMLALPIKDKKVLCIDIGGGSTEIILGNKGKILFSSSIKIGAVRLMNKYFPDYHITKQNILKCRIYVEEKLSSKKDLNFEEKYNLVIGASGTIHAAAAMVHYDKYKKPLANPNGYSFTKKEFNKIYDKVLNIRTSLERLGINGLEAKRADIIPAGLIILDVIINLFNIKKIKLSTGALREGIVFDSMK
ncbi:MAG: exopolyphosphatase [Ignavibacteriales bacterium CG_4_9_14_3_um_filter_30_11]|nr:MAG: exopolyphosphatase [Ignavibacteriales bacterium CG_4_9_14_3_um_filter_30_11]